MNRPILYCQINQYLLIRYPSHFRTCFVHFQTSFSCMHSLIPSWMCSRFPSPSLCLSFFYHVICFSIMFYSCTVTLYRKRDSWLKFKCSVINLRAVIWWNLETLDDSLESRQIFFTCSEGESHLKLHCTCRYKILWIPLSQVSAGDWEVARSIHVQFWLQKGNWKEACKI